MATHKLAEGIGQRVGGGRSAALEVGGKGQIIADCELRKRQGTEGSNKTSPDIS
jgi:hypothetical protein